MQQIILNNFSDFEVGMSNDGGKYWFKTIFTEIPDGRYVVSYQTSSNLDYCSKCGEWHDGRKCDRDYEIISKEEVNKRVNTFKELYHDDDRCSVEVISA